MAKMDPDFLGLFMLLSTQQNWVGDLLPDKLPQGKTEPDYKKTRFYNWGDKKGPGVLPEIQQQFFAVFGSPNKPSKLLIRRLGALAKSGTQRELYRGLFDLITLQLKEKGGPINYSPPPCPKAETVRNIIEFIKSEPKK
jgi:hypothetical protein